MIYEALAMICAELRAYVKAFDATANVDLGSICVPGAATDALLLSLVNVEEESALKNSSPYVRNATGGFDLVNPPVFLNLFVLIGTSFTDNATYATALKRLAWAVQCFQRKKELNLANTPTDSLPDEALRLRLSLDLYSLSFEKINQLWGTLGGKQVPFVVYKVRVVEEQAESQFGSGAAITTIEGRTEIINPTLN